MRLSFVAAACAAVLVSVVLVGCTGSSPSQAVVSPSAVVASTPSLEPTPSPTASPEPTSTTDPAVPSHAEFDASRFSNGAAIDNAWLPLQPGRRWITEGVTIEDGERIPHKISFTVTSLTKMIAGVRTA